MEMNFFKRLIPKKIDFNLTEEEIDLLAKVVYGEARGEPQEGKVAVCAVVLNRIKSKDFPDKIKDIVYQKDAFTAVDDGQINLEPDDSAYDAVYEALKGKDPTEGALYYWNPVTATSQWVKNRTIIKQIGRHVFAK